MCTSQTLLAEALPEEEVKKKFGGIIAELIGETGYMGTSPSPAMYCGACGIGAHSGCGSKRPNGKGGTRCCCGEKE
ncbi:hypothetical protein [Ktedonospora formicarum]|uniref:Uncharacterized protein n=1 Tax=Ktedonospora formicarum TaxID=2778364 RepID=A0A8J3I507_9CHLR|nr:hypothetical protein [Ktedonospora formicarum]GHO47596.1 hypothetical protein KSX_57590 [Ktedonospora formicarum]